MRRDGTATLHNRLSGPFAALAVAAAMVAGQITLGAPEAYACSCAPSNTQQYIDRADVVLVGRAVSVENTWEGKSTFSSADPRLVEFEVERYYKGTGPDYVIVSNPMGSASCGYFTDDAPGMRFLLFVKSSREPDFFTTDLCMGNAMLVQPSGSLSASISEVEVILGQGVPPEASETVGEQPEIENLRGEWNKLPAGALAGIAVTSALVLGVAAYVLWGMWRR